MINLLVSSSTCADYALASTLSTIKQVFQIVCTIIPIILILSLVLSFLGFVVNPDAKDKGKKVIQKVAAAIIIFIIPSIVNITMGLLDRTGLNLNADFTVASCWSYADEVARGITEATYYSGASNSKTSSGIFYDLNGLRNHGGAVTGYNYNDFDDYKHLSQYNQTGKYGGYTVCGGLTGTTIAAGGCGLSSYMAARYVLTGKDTDFLEFAHESCRTGLFNGIGSEWRYIDEKNGYYEKKYKMRSNKIKANYNAIVKELKKGRPVIAMINYGRRNIEQGGFNMTANLHYIVLVNYDDKKDRIYVYNPSVNNTGWTKKSIINKYVIKSSFLLRSMTLIP